MQKYAERLPVAGFLHDDIEKVLKYGIACYKKRCRVALADRQAQSGGGKCYGK